MASKCPTCNKGVYPMDKHIALDGLKYHTSCAKCIDCGCQITLSNFCKTPERTLLCKTHYFRRFHEENSYIGGDKYQRQSSRDVKAVSPSSSSSSSSSSPVSSPSPSMPSLENSNNNDNNSEKSSFFEKDQQNQISVKDLIKKSSSVSSSPSSPSSSKPSSPAANRFASLGAKDKCPVCVKTIYPMDKHINLDGSKYHSGCAKCVDCKCQISLSNFCKTPDPAVLVCKTHYFRRFHEENCYLGGEKFNKMSDRDSKSLSRNTSSISSSSNSIDNEKEDDKQQQQEQEEQEVVVVKIEETEGKKVVVEEGEKPVNEIETQKETEKETEGEIEQQKQEEEQQEEQQQQQQQKEEKIENKLEQVTSGVPGAGRVEEEN